MAVTGRRARERIQHGWRVAGWLVVAAATICAVYLAATWTVARFSSAPAPAKLPATPWAWLDAYEAAAIDDPGRVCSQLFEPALAHAYTGTGDGSCTGYFRQITSFSVTVRRLFEDGSTTVLELRQNVRPHVWAVVLDRRHGGWQAGDLLDGNLAR